MMHPIFVFGPVGAGKTTVAQALATALPDALLIPEPVDDNPFLPRYAVDRARWALACQTHYYFAYVRACEPLAARNPTYAVIDAGAPTNTHVYGRYLQSLVTPDEYALYQTLTTLIAERYAYPAPACIVSVEAPLQVCIARLQARGRGFELAGHTQEYLAALHSYTADMVAHYAAQGVPVVRVDAAAQDVRNGAVLAQVAEAVQNVLR
jgi:deoxyadenosine/deoxycytidine kinase